MLFSFAYFFDFRLLLDKKAPLQINSTLLLKSTFDFLKQVNRYKANSFTKFLFSKAGYEVYLDNEELPEELYYNKCSALHVDVKDKSNLFATRNYIELVDCNGNLLLFTSKLGD